MILIDSSVWIEYFKGNPTAIGLNPLIDTNAICINDLILSELLPSIIHKRENALKDLLQNITKLPLAINWDRVISMQTLNLRNGLNRIGISDLIIAQNAIDHHIPLFSLDKHFSLMSGIHGLNVYNP